MRTVTSKRTRWLSHCDGVLVSDVLFVLRQTMRLGTACDHTCLKRHLSMYLLLKYKRQYTIHYLLITCANTHALLFSIRECQHIIVCSTDNKCKKRNLYDYSHIYKMWVDEVFLHIKSAHITVTKVNILNNYKYTLYEFCRKLTYTCNERAKFCFKDSFELIYINSHLI